MFKTGDRVFTRDGREVEILKVDAPGRKPIIAMYVDDGAATKRHADGKYYDDGDETDYDLLPPKRTREVTVWVNIWEDGHSVYRTEKEARVDDICLEAPLAVAVPATFTLEW